MTHIIIWFRLQAGTLHWLLFCLYSTVGISRVGKFIKILVEFLQHSIVDIVSIDILSFLIVSIRLTIILTTTPALTILTTIMYCSICIYMSIHLLYLIHRLLFLILLATHHRCWYSIKDLLFSVLITHSYCTLIFWLLSLCNGTGRTIIYHILPTVFVIATLFAISTAAQTAITSVISQLLLIQTT